MSFSRFLTHSFSSPRAVKKFFPKESMDRITQAIQESEAKHDAEIVFAIEPALAPLSAYQGHSARERAIDVFSQLRVWDTEANNGVMIYLLLADHDIEIVADRGVNRLAGPEYWEKVCKTMEEHFRNNQFEQGVIEGIRIITELLAKHYPKTSGDENELTDRPIIV